jgi:hypothetical protein
MTVASLWPDIPVDNKPRGMKQFLEEAGADIREKTNGLIVFEVSPSGGGELNAQGVKFYFQCHLRVPRVSFKLFLLTVVTGPTPFPANVHSVSGVVYKDIADLDGLRKVLAEIFQSQETKDAILSLIANFG